MTTRRSYRPATESDGAAGSSHPSSSDDGSHTHHGGLFADPPTIPRLTLRALHRSVPWPILGSVIAIVAFVLGSSVDLGLPRLLGHSSETLSGAAVLGVSIAFTGIVVSGFLLVISRVNALAAVDDDAAEAEEHVARGEAHAGAIRAYRNASRRTDA